MRTRLKLVVGLLVCALVTACSNLKPDPALPSLAANYLQFEAHSPSKRCVGDGSSVVICSIPRGALLESLDFSFQGYFTGSYRAFSDGCGLDIPGSYIKTGSIPLPVSGVAEHDCTIDVTLSPNLPDQASAGFKLDANLRGAFIITVTDDETWDGALVREPVGPFVRILPLSVGGSGQVQVIAAGCGITYNAPSTIFLGGFINLPLQDMVSSSQSSDCVLTGAIKQAGYQDLLFTLYINRYEISVEGDTRKFTPLPNPVVTLDAAKQQMCISGDASISILMVDDTQNSVSSSHCFSHIDLTQEHWIRALTTGGRIAVGYYMPGALEISWVQ